MTLEPDLTLLYIEIAGKVAMSNTDNFCKDTKEQFKRSIFNIFRVPVTENKIEVWIDGYLDLPLLIKDRVQRGWRYGDV